jgi:hypothetical protein
MTATISPTYSYKSALEAAYKVNWRIEDIIGGDKQLDFTKPFMPEVFAGVQTLQCLNAQEKLVLNQIRGNNYLHIFGVVEEFIVPLVVDHVREVGTEDIYAAQALLCFAEEETKHIHLFRRFAAEFERGFGTSCSNIGPAEAIANHVLQHNPLGVALVILQIEWMTQTHYLGSIRDHQDLDPQFTSLLKHHWMEEAQHAKLDTLMIEHMARVMDPQEIQQGIEDYFAIGQFIHDGLMAQVGLDIESLERATGRRFTDAEKQEIRSAQAPAYQWTFLGSGMIHPNFLKTLAELSESAAVQVQALAQTMGASSV